MAGKIVKTSKRTKKGSPMTGIGIIGIARVNIVNPDGSIAADSGWHKNRITNVGLADYLCKTFLQAAGSQTVAYMAVGKGTDTLATNATAMTSQCAGSHMVTVSSSSSSRASSTDGVLARHLATFVSNGFAAATTIGQAGLHYATDGSIMCAATFVTSAVATNQAINCTYDISFVSTTV